MTQKSMLAWGLGILAIIVVAIAIWQTRSDDDRLPVSAKIGGLLPFTGDLAAFGKSTLSGIELAVAEVNAAGGVIGGRLELIVGDTETNPQAGVIAAQKLAGVDGVSGIVGARASGVTIPVAQSVAAVSGVPMVSPSATSPVITGLADNDFLFRTTPHDAVQGVLLADLVTDQGIDRVAMLYRNDDYGKGLAEAFAVNYTGHITSIIGYEPGQPTYGAELSQSAAAGEVEALVMISFPEEGIPILRRALEQGFFERFVFTDGMKANDVVEAIGQQYLETSFGTAQAAVESEGLELYRAHYEAIIGEIPDDRPFIENAYDGTILLALAI
ncbi:MAG: ABC transporter substrate-binding protein, partial [Alphaproteobacteria bacterium]|nr:ABC transporter substrate-binding protein [Alphaproteobacteria bacterium]